MASYHIKSDQDLNPFFCSGVGSDQSQPGPLVISERARESRPTYIYLTMVLILEGNSKKGANVKSAIGIMICSRHLFSSTAASYMKHFLKDRFPTHVPKVF